MNIANVPLAKAREYTEGVVAMAGKSFDELFPDFDANYMRLQKNLKQALDIKRVDMPVIRQSDMVKFAAALKTGRIDIFKPWAKGHLHTPKDLTPSAGGKEWLRLGFEDGDMKDDVVGAQRKKIPAVKLRPTQKEIWLEKVVNSLVFFGPPSVGMKNAVIIVSKEGYILDGHHRYGQVLLSEPSHPLDSLLVPLPIKLLIAVGRSFGNAVGNEQRR